MNGQQQASASTHPQEDLGSPSCPGVASVWVGGARDTSRGSTGSGDSARRGSGSTGDGEYVLVSVKKSISDSESSSRKSSGTGGVLPSSVAQSSNAEHSRSSSNSSYTDPFSPVSPLSINPYIYGQNFSLAGNGGNVLASPFLGNVGNSQDVSSGNDLQNFAQVRNTVSNGNSVLPCNTNSISSSAFVENVSSNQNSALAGTAAQDGAFFTNAGRVSNMALAGNTNTLFAANPGQMLGSTSLLYNRGAFLPAATSGMAVLPQGGFDPSSLLLQQQYALRPDLLAASLGQTLSLSPGQPVVQNLDPTQTQAMQQNPSLLPVQAPPVPQNLNLLQTQALLQNLTLSQTQGAQGAPQNLTFLQAENPGLSRAQLVPQSLDLRQPLTSLPQSAGLQQPRISPSQPGQDSVDSLQHCPPMGHSFEVLSAVVAANQAQLSSPLQSPTTPVFSPSALSSQLMPMGSPSGLPPSLTGLPPLHSADPVIHDHQGAQAETDSPSEPPDPRPGDRGHTLHTSSSLDNGDDQTTSGVGSSASSSPSDSNPTSPNSDLYSLTSEEEGNVQPMRVEPRYERPLDKEACMRCGKKVYNMEKLGPVKDVLYHKTCFTCVACHTQLNLKNFHNNDSDLADLNVFCASHKPSARAKPLDSNALGIRRALTVPRHGRINEQIRGGPDANRVHLDSRSVSIHSAMHAPAPDLQASIKQREGAWFREQRKSEGMPPPDVVRHDEQSEKYEGSRSLYSNPS